MNSAWPPPHFIRVGLDPNQHGQAAAQLQASSNSPAIRQATFSWSPATGCAPPVAAAIRAPARTPSLREPTTLMHPPPGKRRRWPALQSGSSKAREVFPAGPDRRRPDDSAGARRLAGEHVQDALYTFGAAVVAGGGGAVERPQVGLGQVDPRREDLGVELGGQPAGGGHRVLAGP